MNVTSLPNAAVFSTALFAMWSKSKQNVLVNYLDNYSVGTGLETQLNNSPQKRCKVSIYAIYIR